MITAVYSWWFHVICSSFIFIFLMYKLQSLRPSMYYPFIEIFVSGQNGSFKQWDKDCVSWKDRNWQKFYWKHNSESQRIQDWVSKFCSNRQSFTWDKELYKTKLVVVDTPGFLDTHRDSKEINKEIMKSIGFSVPGPHAILYVMWIGDRINNDEKKCMRMFIDMSENRISNF